MANFILTPCGFQNFYPKWEVCLCDSVLEIEPYCRAPPSSKCWNNAPLCELHQAGRLYSRVTRLSSPAEALLNTDQSLSILESNRAFSPRTRAACRRVGRSMAAMASILSLVPSTVVRLGISPRVEAQTTTSRPRSASAELENGRPKEG